MADMTQEELAELLNYVEDNGLAKTMEKYNMTIDELIDIYPVGEEILQARPDLMDEAIKLLGGDQEEGSMEILDDGSFNPEDDQPITSEFMPGDTMVGDAITWLANKAGIPEEAALALAGITSKNPAKVKKAADGMFTPKMTKKGTADKRGTKSAEVKESGTVRSPAKEEKLLKKEYGPADGRKVDKDKQLVVSPQGDLVPVGNKKKGILANLSKKDKQAIGTTAGLSALTTAIGLSGDRGDDGSLKSAPITDKEVVKEPEPKEQETVNDCSQFGPGFHKLPGQNFCTRNDADPYWKTDAGRIELGEMEPPKPEFDIDKFMSLFR